MPRALALVRWVVLLCVLGLGSLPAQGWVDVSNPANTPGGRSGHAMVYDEARGYCLLTQGDTWTYDGTTWVQRFPATLPVAPAVVGGVNYTNVTVFSYQVVFQSHNQKPLLMIYHAGNNPGQFQEAGLFFYEWDGQDWAVHSSIWPIGASIYTGGSNPQSQTKVSLTYDRLIGQAVVFATADSFVSGSSARTWTFSGGGWQLRSPLVFPPAIGTGGLMRSFYDESRGRVVVIISGSPGASMWEWSGAAGNWSQCFPSYLGYVITSGTFGPIAYDSNKYTAIGLGRDQPYTTRTLAYGACDIELMALGAMPAVRTNYAIAFDRQRGKFVMQGGSGYADTWELDLGPSASYSLFGAGCLGSRGVPTLATNGFVPVGGQTMFVQVNNLPFTAPTFMFLGFSDTTYAGLALPFDLNVLGAPGCNLRVSGDQLSGVTNVLGVGLWQFPVPNMPGAVFYNQAIVFDPLANPLGLTLSNGGRGVIGN